MQRVRLRVEKGGHDVPEASVRRRWSRSLEQLPWFLQQADQAAIFDNSGAIPQLVGRKQGSQLFLDPGVPHALRDALVVSKGDDLI